MQILNLTGTLAGTQPVYLPYDKAPVPFGDPLAATLTAATPTVVTVPGYAPSQNDLVSLTVSGTTGYLATQAGNISSNTLQIGQTYYVTSISGDTFSLTTQANGSGVACWSTLTQFGGIPFVHLLSNQVDGVSLPFKPGNSVVALNAGSTATLTTVMTAPITLFGAADKQTGYGAPQGPGAYAVIATVAFGVPKIIQLNYDWIVASAGTGTLVLIQN